MSPTVSIAVLTRDLRVHDNPTLHGAVSDADAVVPLFVLDRAILRSDYNRPNRARFLVECLRDLDASLADRGAGLVVRDGDWVHEVVRVAEHTGAVSVHVAGDVTAYARRRVARLRAALPEGVDLVVHDETLFVVPPGELLPSGGAKDHMAVFTPYFRKWSALGARELVPTPRSLALPARLAKGRLPAAGGRVSLHTELVVKEDGWSLYGFDRPVERMVFQRLLGASGFGPKLALALLSALGPERTVRSVLARALAPLPVLLELCLPFLSPGGRLVAPRRGDLVAVSLESHAPRAGGAEEAVRALMGLGYGPVAADDAVRIALTDGASQETSQLIRRALQELAAARGGR